eukprot:gb/GFBE01014972.1/.p1 GENE.gb/GFBE01014972.1/~~gb/GFBE01014972.1/.p1  ORF type:complete len:262 (+),score=61.95 gb/GFBE01014972.1/:1-786(+)
MEAITTLVAGRAQIYGLVVLVVPLLAALAFFLRRRPLPGRLKAKGSFEHEDPANPDSVAERRRDFCRIAATKRDIWVFTSDSRQPSVLPVEFPPGMGPDAADTSGAEKVSYQKLKWWLQQELGKIPGAVDLGMTSQWPVVDRVLYFTSVSPGFDFVMSHKVPPMLFQTKYLIMVSKSGQVRVAWFSFVTDKVTPGATAGPFVVKLFSEDLKASSRDDRTFSKFTYTAKPAAGKDMEKIISGLLPAIMKGINEDKWDAFERA